MHQYSVNPIAPLIIQNIAQKSSGNYVIHDGLQNIPMYLI